MRVQNLVELFKWAYSTFSESTLWHFLSGVTTVNEDPDGILSGKIIVTKPKQGQAMTYSCSLYNGGFFHIADSNNVTVLLTGKFLI